MDGVDGRLRVVVTTDLTERLCRVIEESDPRLEVVRDHALYRPMRWTADWSGDPNFVRPDALQERLDTMVDSADVLFGIPDGDPDALRRTVAANPRLRWVHTTAAGGGSKIKLANLDRAALDRITFTSSAGVHSDMLAEFALFGVLAGAKNLPRLRAEQNAKEWNGRWLMRKLCDMTVLIVGLGSIGRACAQRFSAMGAYVLGTTRSSQEVDGVYELVPIEKIDDALPRADAIVAALPGTSATEELLGPKTFAITKPGVILCNVGRGTVIDETAMTAALFDGRIAFAALDVLATEPLPEDSPLWELSNVLISPHTAALHPAEEERVTELFVENAQRFLDGRPMSMQNVVDTIEFY
jgi:phosphoglycerate dehydrogenase-like enzyme